MPASEPTAQTIDTEPFYATQGDEVALFEAAWHNQLPVLLKRPTGCGKTPFKEYMATLGEKKPEPEAEADPEDLDE